MRLRKAALKLLERERVCRVATVGEDGTPHVVPVCHVVIEGKLYFGAASDSQKVRNLATAPRVAVLVDIYSEDWDRLAGVVVQGTARLIRRGPQFRSVRAHLYRKYPQYATDAALEEGSSVVVEVTPTRAATWGLE